MEIDKQVAIFDNGGRSFDRYTVIYLYEPVYTDRFFYVAMSKNPYHPQGFGQHGEMVLYANELTQLRKGKGRRLFSHLGERILFSDLPEDCQKLVIHDLEV